MKILITLLLLSGVLSAGKPDNSIKNLKNKVRTEIIKHKDGSKTEYTIIKLPNQFILGIMERVFYKPDGKVKGRITSIYKTETESYNIAYKGMHKPYYTEYTKLQKDGKRVIEYRDPEGKIMLSAISAEKTKFFDAEGVEAGEEQYLRLIQKLHEIE